MRAIVPSAAAARPLTALEARAAGTSCGIYAAWITAPDALRQIGAPTEVPVLAYVGKAVATGGLAKRLQQHLASGLRGLDELLAVRGHMLYSWWGRIPKPLRGRYPQWSAMSDVTWQQLVEWQLENVCWSWRACPRGEAKGLEDRAIKTGKPLLNDTSGAGTAAPQLRYIASDASAEAARARWLWQLSWASLLGGELPRGRWADEWLPAAKTYRFQVDDLGYPVPRSLATTQHRTVSVDAMPTPRELEQLMFACAANAPPVVRNAVGQPDRSRIVPLERGMWWAAHAAAFCLPDPMALEAAMSASLGLADEWSAAGPKKLPSEVKHRAMLGELRRACQTQLPRH